MLANFAKIILLILLLASATFYVLFTPSYYTTVFYKGQIRIERDNFSIPTLHVSTIEQYLYALGTVEAEDRLFQIAFRSYAAQGRLSEFIGEKALQFDRFMREVNFKKWGQQRAKRFKKQNATQYAQFEAMIFGINQRVAKMYVLPMQFYLSGFRWQNFTINHLFYLAVQFEWGISMNIVDEYTRSALLANYTKEQIEWILPNKKEYWAFQSIPIVSNDQIPQHVRTENVKDKLQKIKFNPLSVDRLIQLDIIESFSNNFDASNCWVVSGQYTESGYPILSSDPHLQNIVPSQWYQFKVNYKDQNGKRATSVGATNPGSPHTYGKTSYFATGYTISHGDNQDLYRQTIQGSKYLVDGKWRDLKIRNETILVKTSSGIRLDHYEVRQTHRGPIIHYIFGALGSYSLENDTISLAWTGFNTEWQSFIKISYLFLIDNLEDLRFLIQNHTKTFLNANILGITADNHIIMQQSGLHPIRRNSQSGTFIKDGSTTQHDWVGIVPPTDRMHIIDPPKGYIVNANNRVAEKQFYGGYLDYTIYTARADRLDQILRQEINSGRKITIDFVKKTFLDTVDVYCRQILPQIIKVVYNAQVMQKFDCDFRAESHLATIYEVFMYELYHLIKPFSPEKMSLITFHQMQQGIYNYIHFAFRGDLAKQQIMKKAWKKALIHLQTHFKSKDQSKWLWGQFHIDTNYHVPFKNHPILSRIFNLQFPGSGNAHTPNVGRMQQLQFGNFRTTHRANLRAIYGFGDDHPNWYINDGGASQNILSKHYSDQNKLLQRGEMIEMTINDRENKNENDL